MVIKMKKLKVLLLCVAFLLFATLVGCTVTNPSDGGNGSSTITELSAPTNLRIVPYENFHILFFDEVKDAKEYDIRVFKGDSSSPFKIGKVTFADVLEGYTIEKLNGNIAFSAGEYKVAVRAIADRTTTTIDSKFSEKLGFSVVDKVDETDCAVTFDTNGGSVVEAQVVKKGQCAMKPADPKMSGYEFVCWLKNGFIFNFETPITNDTILVASWKKSTIPSIELTDYYKSILDGSGNIPTGVTLKLKLRAVISKGVLSTTYDQLRNSNNGLGYTDADPKKPGNLILFYSQQSISAKWDGGNTWNREHVIPKSIGWGYNQSGPGSDIHHIRPADNRVNSTRNNLKAGYVTGGKTVMYNGLPAGTYNSQYFEPNDDVKGDMARIYLYMITRYAEADNWNIKNAAQSLEVLLEWHHLDPVSEFELLRNERSYQIQKNRNPFIDYPEFVDMIWSN